jgi:NDP-sugar pyrophosphorylase family protein
VSESSTPEAIAEFFDLSGFEQRAVFDGCTYPWEALDNVHDFLMAMEHRIDGDVSPHAVLEGSPIVIEEGAVVEAHTLIKAPIFIGRGARVAHGAYLRRDLIIGAGATIGTIEATRSIFLDGAITSHYNAIMDTIFGRDAHLGGFAATPNVGLREPGRGFTVRWRDQTFDLGDKKLGAIIGDGAEVGTGAFLMPGTMLGRKSIVYPCLSVRGYHPPESLLKGTSEFHEPRIEFHRPKR